MDICTKYREVLKDLVEPFPQPKSIEEWHLTLFCLPSFRPERIYDLHYDGNEAQLHSIEPASSVWDRVLQCESGAHIKLPTVRRNTKRLRPDSPLVAAVKDELPEKCRSVNNLGLDGETFRLIFTFHSGVHEAEIWEPFSMPSSNAWIHLIELLRNCEDL